MPPRPAHRVRDLRRRPPVPVPQLRTKADLEARTVFEAADFGGWVWVEVVSESETVVAGERLAVGSGWHRFELDWRSGTAGDTEGEALFRVGGRATEAVPVESISAHTVDMIRLGALDGFETGGWLALDDYRIVRTE